MFGERPSNNSDSREANELDVALKFNKLFERIKKLGGGKEEYKFKGDKGEDIRLYGEKDKLAVHRTCKIKKTENGKVIKGIKNTYYTLRFSRGQYDLSAGSEEIYNGSGSKIKNDRVSNLSSSDIIGNVFPKLEERIKKAENSKILEERKKALDAEKEKQKRLEKIRGMGREYAHNDLDKQLEDDLNNLV